MMRLAVIGGGALLALALGLGVWQLGGDGTRRAGALGSGSGIALGIDVAPNTSSQVTLEGPSPIGTLSLDGVAPSIKTISASAGSYAVTQKAASGFSLVKITCTDPDGGTTTHLGLDRATIDLDGGETVSCLFTSIQTTSGQTAASALQSLGFTGSQAAQELKNAKFTAEQAVAALKAVYAPTPNQVTSWTKNAGYATDRIAIGLATAYSLAGQAGAVTIAAAMAAAAVAAPAAAVAVHVALGAAITVTAVALASVSYAGPAVVAAIAAAYAVTDPAVVGEAARLAGLDSGAVAVGLRTAFAAALAGETATASALAASGYAATAVAVGLGAAFAGTTSTAIATAMKAAGFNSTEIATALKVGLGKGAETVAEALDSLYSATTIARRMADVFDEGAADTAQILKNVGFGATSIARALRDAEAYTQSATQTAVILSGLGYGIPTLVSVLSAEFSRNAAQITAILVGTLSLSAVTVAAEIAAQGIG
jgi:hypothetical protein